MPRRKKTLDEVAARRGLEATEYVRTVIETEWKGALRRVLRKIVERADGDDPKAQYYIADYFLAKANVGDPADARAEKVLRGIAKIRSGVTLETDGDADETESGDWADYSFDEGEDVHLEPDEAAEAGGEALPPVADVC